MTADTPDGEVNYTHRCVEATAALCRASTPVDAAPERIRRTVRTGSSVSGDPLPGRGTLIRTADGFYVVDAVAVHEMTGERSIPVRLGRWVGGGVALGLVYRAGRLRER